MHCMSFMLTWAENRFYRMEESMNYQILVVEDDMEIISLLRLYLEAAQYDLYVAQDGESALEAFHAREYALIIMDIMLPDISGYELIKKIRESSNTPILILSAKNHEYDRILGLNLGADDYLTKPFDPLEFVARVNANIRRFYKLGSASSDTKLNQTIVCGDLTLDMNAFTVIKRGKVIPLTSTQFKILAKLMGSPNRIFPRSHLHDVLSGDCIDIDSNTINMHISKIREKIEDDPKKPKYIKTVKGLGYKFEKPE